jgi:hypothetical protein
MDMLFRSEKADSAIEKRLVSHRKAIGVKSAWGCATTHTHVRLSVQSVTFHYRTNILSTRCVPTRSLSTRHPFTLCALIRPCRRPAVRPCHSPRSPLYRATCRATMHPIYPLCYPCPAPPYARSPCTPLSTPEVGYVLICAHPSHARTFGTMTNTESAPAMPAALPIVHVRVIDPEFDIYPGERTRCGLRSNTVASIGAYYSDTVTVFGPYCPVCVELTLSVDRLPALSYFD